MKTAPVHNMALAFAAVLACALPSGNGGEDVLATRDQLPENMPGSSAPPTLAPLEETLTREQSQVLGRLFTPIAEKEAALDVARTHRLLPGERVVVRGRIIGAERLFEKDEALLMIADPAYVVPDDRHAHPYRASTVPADVKRAHMLSVQVCDSQGHILPVGLRGVHGLKEMDYVVISGVMDSSTTASSPVVDAEAIEQVEQWQMEAPSVESDPVEEPCLSCAAGTCPADPDPGTPAKRDRAAGKQPDAPQP